jgi:hypothetical protein
MKWSQNEDTFNVVRLGEVLIGPSSGGAAIVVPGVWSDGGLDLFGIDFLLGLPEIGAQFVVEFVG